MGEIARTFGVDWPHLLAQIVSFSIVCGVLYLLAYKPILQMLAARREQITRGLADAEKIKAELAAIEIKRREVLARAEAEGRRRADHRPGARSRRARARTDAGRAQTRSRAAGRADERGGHRKDSDARGPPAPRRGDGQAAGKLKRRATC